MEKKKKFSLAQFLTSYAMIIVLLILAFLAFLKNPRFLSGSNFRNILINVSPRFLIALGVSGCLITRGTDLSAGRQIGLATCIAGTLLQSATYSKRFFPDLPDMNIVVVLLITMAVCGLFGMLNGIVIAFLKVPPFISSLGIQTIVYGACLVYSGAEPLGGLRTDFTGIATKSFFKFGTFKGIPLFVVIAVVAGALMWVLYNKTPHGKYMYAVGGNENAAEVSGVKVKRTLVIIYSLAAVLYASGGFLVAAKAGGGGVNYGLGYELEAIASCTIGGVSTTGGVGRIPGILVGVLVFEVLKTAMQYLQIDTSYQYIVQGVVIITAVALDLRKYLARK